MMANPKMKEKKMKSSSIWIRKSFVLAVGALCLALAASISAQVQTQTSTTTGKTTHEVEVQNGEVVAVEGNSLFVKMSDGTLRDFPNVPESAKITVGGQQLGVHQLKPGMKLQRTTVTSTTPQVVTTVETVTGKVWHVTPPLLAKPEAIFPNVPVVFCCTAPGQIDQMRIDHRSTGSWFQLEPAKTVEAALGLLPETRHMFVVGGGSDYDRRLTALVKTALTSYEKKLDVTYLADLPMSKLQERLRHLPDHSMVLYLSFFKDVDGREFLNVAEALPMITGAANAPVFGISDTYLGHGIVGGFVVSFEEQGKIVGRDALEILAGKPPQDIPVVHGPSVYLFDSRELQRWKLDASKLPTGGSILFRQPTLWEEHRRTLLAGSLIIVGLGLLTIYLLFERKQLKRARKAQEQLSGKLIHAQEQERSRLAAEIHDDFSQRLAVLSLGLETAAEGIPESLREINQLMQELMESASELGADLHTLSHRLHSSTLERLGLAAGVAAFCKEFTAQQGIQVAFSHDDLPRSVTPDVAVCLFRIVQEGLRNLQKHSGAANAQVRLRRVVSAIHLSISDDGHGFDMKEVGDGQGLGLWSMQERVRLVDGRFEINSETHKGTRIDVWVPLKEQANMTGSGPALDPVGVSAVTSEQSTD
jgi:signal transduction histidine kinase